jgi:hypothetical protein
MKIAITGLAGSGKDTAAEMLQRILGNAKLFALADLPKQITSDELGIPLINFTDRELKDSPYMDMPNFDGKYTPRQILLGHWDDLFEENGDDYSLMLNIDAMDNIEDGYAYVIISDIRFPIELNWVKQENILLFNIKRDVDDVVDSHISEMENDEGITIFNDGSLEDLYNKLVEGVIKYVA